MRFHSLLHRAATARFEEAGSEVVPDIRCSRGILSRLGTLPSVWRTLPAPLGSSILLSDVFCSVRGIHPKFALQIVSQQ